MMLLAMLFLLAPSSLARDDLEGQLADCQRELASLRDSSLSRVCRWVADPGKEARQTLKQTVSDFLKATHLSEDQPEVQMTISLSADELVALRRFLLTDEGQSEQIQGILATSMRPLEAKDFLSSVGDEATVIVLVSIVAVCVCYVLWKGVPMWHLAVLVAVTSVAWQWVHLYKLALAKKRAKMAKLADVPSSCMIGKKGWLEALTDVIGIGTNADAKCEAYYETLLVDPLWEVTPLRAITETASHMVLKPLEGAGHSIGLFLERVVAPMPWLWKLPALCIAFLLLLALMLAACGYRLKSMFFCIEPIRKTSQKRSLPYPTEANVIDRIEDSRR